MKHEPKDDRDYHHQVVLRLLPPHLARHREHGGEYIGYELVTATDRVRAKELP